MNRAKVLEFFDASKIKQPIHVIGCGAVGSHVSETLARIGFNNVHLYDFDKVESHNISNQNFVNMEIGLNKATACAIKYSSINEEAKVTAHTEGLLSPYTIQKGIVIMCVDDIEVRKAIVKENRYNGAIKGIMDFRMELTNAQYYFANISEQKEIENLVKTMDFTHEEAAEATPKSACGYELSVVYTIQCIVSLGISNLVTFLQGEQYKNMIFNNMNLIEVYSF